MKRWGGDEASGRHGARGPNVIHSVTATNIAALHLRLRPHRHRQNRGGAEGGDREPTKVGTHKHTSRLNLYQIEPFRKAIVSLLRSRIFFLPYGQDLFGLPNFG